MQQSVEKSSYDLLALKDMFSSQEPQSIERAVDYILHGPGGRIRSGMARDLLSELSEVVVGDIADKIPEEKQLSDEATLDEKALMILAKLGDSGILHLAGIAEGQNLERVCKALSALALAQEWRLKVGSDAFPLSYNGMVNLLRKMDAISKGETGVSFDDSTTPSLLASGIYVKESGPAPTSPKNQLDVSMYRFNRPRPRSREL